MPTPLRPDFDAERLRSAACESKDAGQTRRLLALAAIYEGAARGRAAEIGGVTLPVIRAWVLRFNAHGPDGLVGRKAPGQPSRRDGRHRAALAAVVESGPIPAIHGGVRWRVIDPCQWVWDEFRISVSRQTLGRELRAMGYRKLSARPRHHAQAEGAIEAFKGTSLPCWTRSRATRASIPATERSGSATRRARIGQKTKIARRWAPRGTRPSAPQDQRTASTSIFGAICPEQGKAAGLIRPRCNTEAMNLHLGAISAAVAPGRHAVLLVDRAGWHRSWSIGPDGTSRRGSSCPIPSPSSRCPPSARS